MSPRIVIADSVYPAFLRDYYAANPRILDLTYEQQHAHLSSMCFSTGDSYAAGMCELGCDAQTIYMNVRPLQRQWAREHGFALREEAGGWDRSVFVEQMRVLRPDVIYVQEISAANDDLIGEVKPFTQLLVGQVACTLPPKRTFLHHDLIVSSWKPLVEHFRHRGKHAAYMRLGFNSLVSELLGDVPPAHDVTFVGGLDRVHSDRMALLEHLCEHVPMHIYGYGAEALSEDSIIRSHHHGSAWGVDAARIMSGSAMTVNVHGDIVVAGRCDEHLANNQRLFEATGVGTLLITDWKEDLHEALEPGVEVVTYRSPDECVEKVNYYLEHEAERLKIAAAGQTRTLREHTYRTRMEDLLAILREHLPGVDGVMRRVSPSVASPLPCGDSEL